MVSIMTDLHDFWTYENREVIVTDAKEGSEALGPFPLNGPTLYIHPPDMSTLCHIYVGHIDPVRFSFPSHSFVRFIKLSDGNKILVSQSPDNEASR